MTAENDFDEFFLLHYAQLVRSLTLITGDGERAQDGVQEAFIKAYRSWRKVSAYDAPLAWVRRVAINNCRDTHRSDTRRRQRERPGVEIITPSEGVVADVYVRQLLDGLPERQRQVTILFYVDDLSIAEIAPTIGISEGAVKFHLNQARERLRSAFVVDRSDHDSI